MLVAAENHPAWAGANEAISAFEAGFQTAQNLAREGKAKEAFFKYLEIPGAEHCAIALAGTNAGTFLDRLQNDRTASATPVGRLIEADLLLATGQREKAKALYHSLAALQFNQNWTKEIPRYYPVERPRATEGNVMPRWVWDRPLLPFTIGPGSQRDNWLLRRLIALELDNDAAQEFARIWDIHRENTQPYISETPGYDARPRPGAKKQVFRPAGFNGQGLQFAIDYAFFLERRGDTNGAFEVLFEATRSIDMDVDPNDPKPEPWDESAARRYPERPYT